MMFVSSPVVADEQLTADELTLVTATAQLANDLDASGSGRVDATRISSSWYTRAAELGLTRIQVPVANGGLGYSYLCKLAIACSLSRVCMPFAFSLINTHNATAKLADYGHAQHIKNLLPDLLATRRFGATALTEPQAGSDFSAIKTSAERSGDGWVLNGEKAWITNAAFADVFICYVQTDAAAGWRGIACFVVDGTRAGFERVPQFELFGANAIGTGGFRLVNYEASDADMIHPPGEAFKAALGSINGARTYVAGMCVAMLGDALASAVDYLREREAFGAPLLEKQGLRWSLADIATDLEAATELTAKAARAVQAGSKDAILAAAHAKKYAARVTEQHILGCIQAMGANGLLASHGLGQHLVCAKLANYVDGSTEIQNERIATLLFDQKK